MYPKTIFKGTPEQYVTEIVQCESEETEFLKLGWDVADNFFKPKKKRKRRTKAEMEAAREAEAKNCFEGGQADADCD